MFKFDKLYGINKVSTNANENVLFINKSNLFGKHSYVNYDDYKMKLLSFIFDCIVEDDEYDDDYKSFFTTVDEAVKYAKYLDIRHACKHDVIVIDVETFLEDTMVKIFMSHPMSGLSSDDVKKLREYHYKRIVNHFGDKTFVKIIDNYDHKSVPEDAGRLWHLGTSVRQMEEADYIYFCDRIPSAKGVVIEREIARIYGLKVLNDEMGYINGEESIPVNQEDENRHITNSSIDIFTSPYQEIYELIGEEGTMKLFDLFKGRQITFPQRVYNTEYVTQYVKAHYNRKNLKELADKFNYSERRIREFLKVEEGEVEKVLTSDISYLPSSTKGNISIKNNIDNDIPSLDSNALYHLKPFLYGYITMINDNGETQYLVCKKYRNEGVLVSEKELISLFQDYSSNMHLYKSFIIVPKEEEEKINFEVGIDDGETSFSIGPKMIADIIKPYVPISFLYMLD